jgi:flagellar assembly factor FliW
MKFAETTEAESLASASRSDVHLPFGLLGFENNKLYELLADPQEAPFLWLQMREDPKASFLVVNPFLVFPEYQPDLSEEDVAFLGLRTPEEAAVFNIVTLRGGGGATMNLKGPIVVNRRTLVAKQCIPVNASAYNVQHPLPVAT